jgi:hypothetical protein
MELFGNIASTQLIIPQFIELMRYHVSILETRFIESFIMSGLDFVMIKITWIQPKFKHFIFAIGILFFIHIIKF